MIASYCLLRQKPGKIATLVSLQVQSSIALSGLPDPLATSIDHGLFSRSAAAIKPCRPTCRPARPAVWMTAPIADARRRRTWSDAVGWSGSAVRTRNLWQRQEQGKLITRRQCDMQLSFSCPASQALTEN